MIKVKVLCDESHSRYDDKPSGKSAGAVKNKVSSVIEATPEEIASMLVHGEVICPGVCLKRNADSFESQQMFLLDVDNGRKKDGRFTPSDRDDIISVEDALHICAKNDLSPSFIYYTFSNGLYKGSDDDGEYEVPKFRVAFVFDEPITDKDTRDNVQGYLMSLIDDPDQSTKNADRLFYGTNTGECCYQDFEAVNELSEVLFRAKIQTASSPSYEVQKAELDAEKLEKQTYYKNKYSSSPDYWKKTIEEALQHIPCSEVAYNEWLSVGTALKNESFDFDVWDSWSSTDSGRYEQKECQKLWDKSLGSIDINGGYILFLAKQYGYQPKVSKAQFHRFKESKSGERYPFDIKDVLICRHICEENNIIIQAGIPFIYENGVFVADKDGLRIKRMIRECIYQDLIKNTRIEQCYKLLISEPSLHYEPSELNKHPKEWINFLNGMHDAKTNMNYVHSPEYLSINQVPMEWTPGEVNKNSISYQFIESIIPDKEDREMFLQYCGLCLTRDSSQQKFLIIFGPGGTGKSTLINMLSNVVGSDNISGVSLQDINKRFYPTALLGKLLNACADIPSQKMEVVDIIKKCTGEDIIMGEHKGGEVFWFRSYAKLLFSANTIPKVYDDKTDAYYRRLMILEIGQKAKHFDNLTERLYEDRQNFLRMIVSALYRMYQKGVLFESSKSKEYVHKLYVGSDTVYAFLEDETEKSASEKVSRKVLFDRYKDYCEDEDRTPLTAFKFRENLENKGFIICKNDGYDFVKGLKLK